MDLAQVVHLGQENIEDIFDTRGIVTHLAAVKRVRLFRKQVDTDNLNFAYWDFERKGALREQLGEQLQTAELTEKDFRPVLELASDFNNYGDATICSFEPGVAVLIGDDEPTFILVCCFKCHDIHIVRRPTANHPKPQIAQVGMSPELESAIFGLARAVYPDDKELQSFKLPERKRSKTPITKATGLPKDPFSTNEPETPKKKG